MNVLDWFRKKTPDGNDDLKTVVLGPEKKERNLLTQWIPEDPDKRDALSRALLMGGAQMMAASGPSSTPTSLFSAMGQGIAGGVGAYDKTLATNAETAKARAAKEGSQMAMQFASSIGGPSGDTGYTTEQLAEILKYQIATGDEAGARDTLGMIQQLQQTGAKNGMVVNEDGSFRLADGYGDSLFDTKKNESLGNAVGQNAQITSDQKDYRAGVEDPAFRAYETDKAKSSATNVTVSTAPKDGKIFEAMDEERKGAVSARNSLNSIYEAKKAIQNGAVTGFGADNVLAMRKAAQLIGVGDPTLIENTETFRSAVAPMIGAMIKDMVGSANISNSDREFAEKAAGGNISLDEASIARLLNIQETVQKDKIARYNSRVDQLYPDLPENQTNRSFFGGIDVPENPYANGQGASQGTTGNERVRVTSQAEYDALPPGTKVVLPDGREGTKPYPDRLAKTGVKP